MKTNPIPNKSWTRLLASKLWIPITVAGTLALCGSANANDWNGTNTASSWNDPLNWNAGTVPAAEGVAINSTNPSYPIITANITSTPSEIVIGGWYGTGRVDHRAGTFATANAGWPPGWMLIGYGPEGNATYNLADTSTTGGTFTGFGTGSGTLNIVDALFMGEPGGGDGNGSSTLNVNTTGSLLVRSGLNVGISGWPGTLNLDHGTIGANNVYVGNMVNNSTTAATGNFNMAGGTVVATNSFNVGNGTSVATGTFNQTGGSVTAAVYDIGDKGTGVFTLSGGTVTATGGNYWQGVQLGQNSGNGTLNLDGGTLTTREIRSLTSIGSGTLNFNGGVLKATKTLTVFYDAFLQDLNTINVRNGGAIIDSAGYNVIIPNLPFNHSSIGGDNATDGGLTKNGNGTLTFQAAATFTGPVVVNGGTLYANIGNRANNADFSYCSGITVNTNATLETSGGALFGWDGSQAKPITVNAGGTMTADAGGDVAVGQVTLNGGTLAGGPNTGGWGSWSFGRAATNILAATDNSTVTAKNLAFYNGASIDVAAGKTLTISGTVDDSNNGQSSLVKSGGTGTLALTGANTYTGNTTINAGTLALGIGGSLNSANITIGSGATFDVSAVSGFTLAAGKALRGSGTIVGNVATAGATSVITPGVSGVGTLTFNANLNLGAGAAPVFEVSTTAASGNDQIVVGGNLTLSSSDTIHISALSGAANLDQTADYVLFSVAGTTTMATTPSLAWDGTAPANYLNYSILKVGQNVVLHYTTATAPSVTAVANPTSLMRNNPVTITATVTQGSYSVASVKVDASSIGGSAVATLVQDASQLPTLVYTNTFVVGAGTLAGTQPLTVVAADSSSPTPLTGTFSFSITVTTEGNLTWNGSAANDNWTSNSNWDGGFAPGYVGDSLTFAGTTRLTPNMDASYSLTGLTFDGSAGSFTIGTSNGSVLTNGANGIVNNSASAQILNVPIKLSASQIINAAAADITLGGGVGGIGVVNMTTTGAGAVTLSGSGSGTLNDLHVQNQLNVSSGTTVVNGILEVGNGLTSAVTLSGGTLSAINSAFWVSVQLGQNGGDGTFNLNGGTLVARCVRSNGRAVGDSGAATLNFNGGTLKASTSLTLPWDTILEELTAINVRNGGAIIDTAGFDILLPSAQPLIHSSIGGDNAIDGGLTKNGNGTLTLDNINTFTGPTTVNGGTLAGNGTIQGALTNGATLAPGDAGVGALTVNGNITLKAGSTNTFTVNGTTSVNSSIIAGGAVNYGGVLKIVPSGSFTAGQNFTLVSGSGATSPSTFSSIVGSPGTDLAFAFTNGVLSVVSTVVGPTGPEHLTNSITGNSLSLAWPANEGWRLQMQTNSLSGGLGTNWVYITDGSINSTNITVDPSKPAVFYRLKYP